LESCRLAHLHASDLDVLITDTDASDEAIAPFEKLGIQVLRLSVVGPTFYLAVHSDTNLRDYFFYKE